MNICDKIMVAAFCAMIFFLPIASAIPESLFGVVFLCYLIKRVLLFKKMLKDAPAGNRVLLLAKAFKPVPNPLNTQIAVYTLAAFLSVIFSRYLMQGVKGFFFDLLQGIFLYFLFIECMTTQKRLKLFLSFFLASFTLIVTDGVVQYFTHDDFIRHNPVTDGRITASFRHANDLGAYLVAALPLVFCLSAVWRTIRFRKKNYINITFKKQFFSTVFFKLLLVVLLAGALFCLGVTYSRSAWLAFVISMFFLFIKRPKWLLSFSIIGALFFSVFIFKMYQEREQPIKDPSNKYKVERMEIVQIGLFHSTGRIEYWRQAYRIIKKSPVFGVGLNAYTKAVVEDKEFTWDGYPHNCYLQIAAETGIVGLVSFLWVLGSLFHHVFNEIKKIQDEFSYNLLIGLTFGYLGFLVQAFFDTTFYSVQLGTLMWLLMGFIVAIPRVVLRSQEGEKVSVHSFH